MFTSSAPVCKREMSEEEAHERFKEILNQFESSKGPFTAFKNATDDAPEVSRQQFTSHRSPKTTKRSSSDDLSDDDVNDNESNTTVLSQQDDTPSTADVIEQRKLRAQQLFANAEAAIERESWADAENDLENVDEILRGLMQTGSYQPLRLVVNRGRVLLLLGFARHNKGDLEAAVRAFEEGRAIFTSEVAESSGAEKLDFEQQLGVLTTNLCESLAFLKRVEDAIPLAQENVVLLKKVFGDDGAQTASQLANLAAYLCSLKRYDEAFGYAKTSLELFEQHFGRADPLTHSAARNFAKLLEDLGRTSERQKFLDSWDDQPDALRTQFNPDHVQVKPEAFERVIDEWKTPRQVFDPEGLLSNDDEVTQDLRDFLLRAEADGVKLPPGIANLLLNEFRMASKAESPEDYHGMGNLIKNNPGPDYGSVPELQNLLPGDLDISGEEANEFDTPEERKKFMKMGFEVRHDADGNPTISGQQ